MSTTLSLLIAITALLSQVNQPGIPDAIKQQAYDLAKQVMIVVESNPQEESVNIGGTSEVVATTSQATTTELLPVCVPLKRNLFNSCP